MAVSSLALAAALTSLSSLFLTLTLYQRPNPYHRLRDDSARHPSRRSSQISRGSLCDHLLLQSLIVSGLARYLANPFFYSCLGYHRFRSSSDIYAVAHLVTLFLHSSQHTQRFLGLGRLPLWRGRFFLRPFICAAPTQAIAVLLICILFGCGTFVPMPHCATDFAFPFYLFRFCCGVLSVVSIQAFLQQITVMASTTAPFTCWPGHQVHLRASCRHSI